MLAQSQLQEFSAPEKNCTCGTTSIDEVVKVGYLQNRLLSADDLSPGRIQVAHASLNATDVAQSF